MAPIVHILKQVGLSLSFSLCPYTYIHTVYLYCKPNSERKLSSDQLQFVICVATETEGGGGGGWG